MTTEPNFGSRTLPTISSTPSARSAIASTETAGGASRVTRSSYAARASSRSARPTTTPPPSDLCSRPVALSTTGKRRSSSAASSPAASVTDTATGKAMPASANSARAASYDVSVTGGAGAGSSSARPAVAGSTRPASTVHARSTSRCTGMPDGPQHLAGRAVRVDRLHDEWLALRRDRVGHLVGRGQLRLGEVGLLGRVATEVAGQQHAVDLVGREQDLDPPGIARDVLLTGAGEVDRVGDRRLRPQRRLELGGDRAGQHRGPQPGRGERVGGHRSVPAPVGEDRGPAAGHPPRDAQGDEQVGHLGRVVHPVRTHRRARGVDHHRGRWSASRCGRPRCAPPPRSDQEPAGPAACPRRAAPGRRRGRRGRRRRPRCRRRRPGFPRGPTHACRKSTTPRSAWLPSETNRDTPSPRSARSPARSRTRLPLWLSTATSPAGRTAWASWSPVVVSTIPRQLGPTSTAPASRAIASASASSRAPSGPASESPAVIATIARAPAATASVTEATKPLGRHAQHGQVDGPLVRGGRGPCGRVGRVAEHLAAVPVDEQHRAVARRREGTLGEDVAPLGGVGAGADDGDRPGCEQGIERVRTRSDDAADGP